MRNKKEVLIKCAPRFNQHFPCSPITLCVRRELRSLVSFGFASVTSLLAHSARELAETSACSNLFAVLY